VSAAPTIVARYAPHARQLAVHSAREPFVWQMAGYGVGKTTALVFEALQLAAVTHPGFEGIVAAPTFPLLFQSWVTEWRRWIPSTWYRLSRDPLFGPFIGLRTDSGESRIWLRSTVDTKSVEGINAAWLVYDEASRETREDPIRVLLARVRRGYPGRQLRHVFAGPPQTRTHWTAQMFGAGVDTTHRGDAMTWTDGTRRVVRARTRDNPHLPDGYERNMRTRPGATKAWCRQWLDAMIGSVEGQIYETFDRDVHVVTAASLAGRQWRDVVAGVDWGWTNYGTFIVVATDGRGDLYVIAEEVHKQRNADDTPSGWFPLMRTRSRDLRVQRVFCDPSRPGDIDACGRALRKGCAALVYAGDNNVAEGIRRVQSLLEWAVERARSKTSAGADLVGRPAIYISDACPHIIGEFEGYVRRRERDGSFSEQPLKKNDHALDSLRYVAMELANAA
jgi:hypothetical protein